jgi:Phosphatidylserine/phosphatidylglycerophosphate/cardiolipin synthases and related enzymes
MRRKKQQFQIQLSALPSVLVALLIGLAGGYEAFEQLHPHWDAASQSEAEIRACFTPENQCQKFIVEAIKAAQQEVLMQSYSFTAYQIAQALAEAKARGLTVSLLIDRSQLTAPYTKLSFLKKAGITILVDPALGIAHNKVLIIDNKLVITGSYNWTNAAEKRNSENVLFIQNKEIVSAYQNRWYTRAQAATPIP